MTENANNGFYMPVAPAYNGGYGNGFGNFGGDWGWIVLLLLCAGGGWGGFGGGFGGFGNMMLGYDFPWLMNGQQNINSNTNNGFRDAMLNDGITGIRSDINGVSRQMCDLQGNITQQLNTNQMASMERSFNFQTATNQGFTNVNSALAGIDAAIAREAAFTRMSNAQDTQKVLDKLCQLELDGVKGQLAQAERDNLNLQNQLNMAAFRESQVAQNAFIQQGFANEVDQLYNRLSSCPVPSTPVYGRTPIFTCNNNGGCNCNSGVFYN